MAKSLSNLISLLDEKDTGLTEKQEKFTAELLKGKPPGKAAFEAFDCKSMQNASVVANDVLNNETYIENIKVLFVKAGMEMDFLLSKHKTLISQMGDRGVALRALQLAYDIMGITTKKTTDKERDIKNQQINILFGKMDNEELKEEFGRITNKRNTF